MVLEFEGGGEKVDSRMIWGPRGNLTQGSVRERFSPVVCPVTSSSMLSVMAHDHAPVFQDPMSGPNRLCGK